METGTAVLVVGLAGVALLAVLVAVLLRRPKAARHHQSLLAAQRAESDIEISRLRSIAQGDADSLRSKGRADADDLIARARADADLITSRVEELKTGLKEQRLDVERREQRMGEREERLDAEARTLDDRSRAHADAESALEARAAALSELEAERTAVLERAARLTAEQAKAELVSMVEG
ncbi:MAG: ribonuclease Y, partial [Jiangellaceae bacterium]